MMTGNNSALPATRPATAGRLAEKLDVLANAPIVVKIALPLVIMMGLSVAMSWYGIVQTGKIKDSYQQVVDLSERGKAAYIASGAIRSISVLVRDMVTDGDPENLKYIEEDLKGLKETVGKNTDSLKTLLPARAADIGSGVSQFLKAMDVVEEVRQAALKGDRDGALYIISSGRLDLASTISQFESLSTDVGRMITAADAAAGERYRDIIRFTVVVGATGAGLTLTAALLMTVVYVSRPLGRVVSQMTRLSQGDLTLTVEGGGRRDEIGATARAVMVFQRAMLEARQLRSDQEALRISVETEKRDLLEQLAGDFQTQVSAVVTSVGAAASRMRVTADELTAVAGNASQQSNAAAGSAGQAAQSVDTVAAATEELSASIREIGERVGESEQIARRAVTGAGRSEQAMEALLKAADQVGEVVRLINTIASRTNLLALNATIEAARAGEAGRGFAIVAQEVKALANQTAQATQGVEQQIDSIRGAAAHAAEAIHGVGEVIARMSEIATAISAAVVQQSHATAEIAQGANRAAGGAGSVRASLEQVIRGAGETGEIAGRVLAAADGLVGESGRLGTAVDAFVAKVRAA